MAGRLTRANRRKLENVCQQKIDLDNLSSLDVDELIPDNVETPSTEESTKVTESVSHNKEQDDASLSEQDSSEDEESPSEEESSSEDEDEDLDELLNKAQAALASQTASIQLEKEPEHDALKKLSKMNTGISINKELYLKPVSGRAKLTPDTVVLVNPGEKASKKASIVLTANKDEGKKLSKKERQVVSVCVYTYELFTYGYM
jgi:U3 small nucleolar RNA-associated protein 14